MIEPAPFSVQDIVPFDADAPLTTAVEFWQIVWLPPADAVGVLEIVRFLFETTFAQGVFPNAVSVSMTVPLAMSAALGS